MDIDIRESGNIFRVSYSGILTGELLNEFRQKAAQFGLKRQLEPHELEAINTLPLDFNHEENPIYIYVNREGRTYERYGSRDINYAWLTHDLKNTSSSELILRLYCTDPSELRRNKIISSFLNKVALNF